MDKKVLSINGLMKHMRDKHNINIGGTPDKVKLRNIGYFHGYKGYRFIKNTSNKLTFNNFDEIVVFYDFDIELKGIFYPLIMFIETALKNYVLESLFKYSKTGNFYEIFNEKLTYYNKYPIGSSNYKKELKKALDLKNKCFSLIAREHNNEIIKHYLNSNREIPLWSLFEVITMGDFGNFAHCLDTVIKEDVSNSIGFNQAIDIDKSMLEKIIISLKDLRNSIAHNNIIFDNRFYNSNTFGKTDIINLLTVETKIKGITFEQITDFFILMIFILKKLKTHKKDMKKHITIFEKSVIKFDSKLPISDFQKIFHTDFRKKMQDLKYYIDNN